MRTCRLIKASPVQAQHVAVLEKVVLQGDRIHLKFACVQRASVWEWRV
jgi:hypothetical protein